MTAMKIDRRTFFRGTTLGLGGLYLAPFVRQLEAATAVGDKPARVLFFVQGNGVYPQEIQPKGIELPKRPDALEERKLAGHEMAMSMEPLAPWTDRMTLIHGLSGRIARGSHNMGFAALGCWPMGKKAYGETVDAALARNLGGIYPHVAIGVDNKGRSMTYNITSLGRGKAAPTLLNPVLALNHYFAAGASGAARKEFDVDTNLLDFMADDVRRMRSRLNSDEKAKLDRYLDAFESMSGRQSKLASLADRIAAHTPKIDPKVGHIVETKTGPTGVFDRLDAQFDIAAGVMTAGLTNVATVTAGAGPDKIGLSCMAEELNSGKGKGYIGSHGIGHGSAQAGMSSAECHARIRRRCLESLARFIRRMESIPEGDGTMLDHTVIVMIGDNGEQHHSTASDFPVLLIGGGGLGLSTGGRTIVYPGMSSDGHRQVSNVWNTIGHVAGADLNEFGQEGPSRRAAGPLSELMG